MISGYTNTLPLPARPPSPKLVPSNSYFTAPDPVAQLLGNQIVASHSWCDQGYWLDDFRQSHHHPGSPPGCKSQNLAGLQTLMLLRALGILLSGSIVIV